MNIISTVFLAFSMSADAFAVAVSKGVALRKPHLKEALRTGLIFGSVEGSMPVIGWAVGSLASGFITSVDHWIAFFILLALGIKMLIDSSKQEEAKEKPTQHKFLALVFAALGSSIDSLGVGVSLAFIEANIWLTSAAIGTATFLMATIGVMTGHMIGRRAGKIAEAMAGVILIAIGIKILFEHIGII